MIPERKKARRLAMVNWYDPPRLASTAVRVIVSTVFGEFADRREAMGSANDHLPGELDPTHDYSAHGQDIWLDYIADTGDGWNSTYAMARLLAQDSMQPGSAAPVLPRASVVVMGGDQVYPTASRLDYYNRLQLPFDTAAKNQWQDENQPDVYAIPGNHDWYDGLSSFMGLFCQRRAAVGAPPSKGRIIGGRSTRQIRSYFALKLPGNTWLWGTDLQLTGYIDQHQIAYFDHVAANWMEKASSVILCVAEPCWANADASERGSAAEQRFRTFSYMENRAAKAGHTVRLIISGDSHHYARHVESARHYITAGGGGAFLHPTHHLTSPVRISSRYPAPDQISSEQKDTRYQREFSIATSSSIESLFPDRATSRKLTAGNAMFATNNLAFTSVMIGVAFLFTWLLAANAHFSGQHLQAVLAAASTRSLWSGIAAYMDLTLLTPWTALFAAAGWGCLYYFSDFRGKYGRWLSGTLHAVAHAIGLVFATLLISKWVDGLSNATFWLTALASLAGGILSSTIFGLYLLISLNFFQRHANEAFSSLANPNFKNFLRLKIAQDGSITIYPIGLTTAPRDDRYDPPENLELKPHLIEPPVVLGSSTAKQ